MIQFLGLVSYQFKTQQRSLLPTKQQKQNETRICYIHQGSIEDFLFWGGVYPENVLSHATTRKTFLGLLGGSGGMLARKILKI